MTRATRVLRADVYDTLEFVALINGGVGANMTFDSRSGGLDVGVCLWGMAVQAGIVERADVYRGSYAGSADEVPSAYASLLPIGGYESDAAVDRLTGTFDSTVRVPFSDWCKELGVVRGEE